MGVGATYSCWYGHLAPSSQVRFRFRPRPWPCAFSPCPRGLGPPFLLPSAPTVAAFGRARTVFVPLMPFRFSSEAGNSSLRERGGGCCAVSGSAAPVPAGASAAAGVVAPGAATSSSHVFVLKADLMKLSCDARASPYVINVENFGWEWLRYPDSLRTAQKYVRERGRVYWDSSHPRYLCAVRPVHTIRPPTVPCIRS